MYYIAQRDCSLADAFNSGNAFDNVFAQLSRNLSFPCCAVIQLQGTDSHEIGLSPDFINLSQAYNIYALRHIICIVLLMYKMDAFMYVNVYGRLLYRPYNFI